ncbi:MAG: pyruvate ferredoxin/flavodoxin oxidoreductase, delta subunit [Defluviitaleaceae bacterium]|jgi:pyruvate ferredoxin oxidoreductase delta subunit|uniref:Pyruvate ferredoxin oxidoreductase n=1 Tax=Defluviitalea raffinosedens TaxID=1450156 RepID=A0A7C8LDP3_9FIRM|nr:4Fe-4S binding protein [Defluviitalea raffinosedens]KAE9636177.1 pyruvate ferredoxin oxidoreductase [Defluviitalea raffinosedens]MBZ4666959.1 pyruvate ferredoxin/flavodoxin oxidoreductase, delta subunit [Defluviitaleaceae bacterium]
MNKPQLMHYEKPKHIKDYPCGPAAPAGTLVVKNAGWRTRKPIVHKEKCTGCCLCYLYCPEGTIFKENKKVGIDYDFCKGCGICARACTHKAIEMIKEGENGEY